MISAYSLERLEKLEQKVIVSHLEELSLNRNSQKYLVSLYDSMIFYLVNGDLDGSFLSKYLEKLDVSSRKSVFDLARRYSYLVFYDGSSRCWIDSVEGVTCQDLDLICSKLLDNYDFLLRIAKEGGELVLEQLSYFQKSSMSQEGSVLDYLRNTFEDDDVLMKFLIEVSSTNGIYAGLTNLEKIKMCFCLRKMLYEYSEKIDYSSIGYEQKLSVIFAMSKDYSLLEDIPFESQNFVSMFLNVNYNF